MSNVTAIIIKNKQIVIISSHYREILKIAKDAINSKEIQGEDLDSGYVIIDCDNKEIISKQDSFSIKELNTNYIEIY